tara:strand:- start:411 stop:1235 length:825 start_codon:yes stop_codon:yes gene_type:complete
MEDKLGWLDNKWDTSNKIKISIRDRGLRVGDGIFETILILKGKIHLLSEHLERWNNGAHILGMAPPPKQELIESLIKQGISKLSLGGKNGIVRLNWSRGNNFNQGIELTNIEQNKANHKFWLEINEGNPVFREVSAMVSQNEQRNPASLLSKCKTFNYGQAIQAKREANEAGYEESILLNIYGKVCCGSTSNLLVNRSNEWFTPPLKSGCLPGIMRQRGIEIGLIKEKDIDIKPEIKDKWVLINSLSCKPIKLLNRAHLDVYSGAKDLWLSLLK